MSDLDSLWFDEVPADVLQLIECFELSADEAKKVVERQAAQVRARAEEEIDAVYRQAEEAIHRKVAALVREIKPLIEKCLKAGKLGEALAIRDRMRGLRTTLLETLPDPGYLHITPEDFGKTFLYEVTGGGSQRDSYYPGIVYGTDVYCGDSSLAWVCVHAGILKPGEKGTVKVTVLDKYHPSFQGSLRNGVTSVPWQGAYPAFRVSRA